MSTGFDRGLRTKAVICILLLVIVSILSLGIRSLDYGLMSPDVVWTTLQGVFKVNVIAAFDPTVAAQRNAIIASLPFYYDVSSRLSITIVTLISGVLLALAGMLYQNVFRNPIAAPTMLGVTSGVNFGIFLLVFQFGAAAISMNLQRYLYCYAGGILVLLIVFALTWVICGRRHMNVINMLLVGSMVSVAVMAVVNYFSDLWAGTDMWDTYYNITQSLTVKTDVYAFISLGTAFLIGFVPIFLMRFSMNAITFTDSDARAFGVNPLRLKILALAAGTIMILAAQIQTGLIAMISIIVPFLVRRLFGATFSKQLLGNMLLGPLVVLICRDIADLIPFVGEGLPLSAVIGVATLPLFIWVMAIQQRNWE